MGFTDHIRLRSVLTFSVHTNAILQNPLTYQPYNPNKIDREISLVFGHFSGSNHLLAILRKNGIECKYEDKVIVTRIIKEKFKHRRKGVSDEEIVLAYKAYMDECDHD